MEKNTVIAIVLSALVLFVSLFVQTVFIAPRQQLQQMQQQEALIQQQQLLEQQIADAGIEERNPSTEEEVEEKNFTIKTNKIKVVFTSKGGDVISYKLLDHLDKDVRIKGEAREDFNKSVTALYAKTGKDVQKVLLNDELKNDKDKLTEIAKQLEDFEKSISLSEVKDEESLQIAADVREWLAVEMVDNVTSKNRAFGISFGNSTQQICDYNFVERIFEEDPYKIGFSTKLSNGLTLAKTYKFYDDEYVFKLDVKLYSNGGFSIGDNAYTLRTPPQIGPYFDPSNNRYDVRQYVALNSGSKKVKKNLEEKVYDKSYDWAGVAGKYFTVLIKPAAAATMQAKTTTTVSSESDYINSQLFLYRKAIDENETNDTYYVYIGPRSESELKKYNKLEENTWGLSDAKFNEAMQTGGFLNWIEVILKWGMQTINKLVKNWGVSIIILTIILRILLFPLNKKTSLGSIKMQQVQPRIKEIQEKYRGEPQKLQMETTKLYKEIGYNPMAGCLPMIFQMIILFALYNVFNNYFEFRGAKFISGWIDDLSIGDSVYKFSANIPFVSGFTMNTIRALPIIYTLSQLISGKITQYGGASSGKQMKFMMYGLPLIFFFLFYNVPSGLLLYWTTSNILQIFQQLIINSMMKKKRLEMQLNAPKVNENVLKFKGGKKKTR